MFTLTLSSCVEIPTPHNVAVRTQGQLGVVQVMGMEPYMNGNHYFYKSDPRESLTCVTCEHGGAPSLNQKPDWLEP